MNIDSSKCAVCKSEPVYYVAPNGKILGCCSNGWCKTRHKPPVSGSDIFAAAHNWCWTYGL